MFASATDLLARTAAGEDSSLELTEVRFRGDRLNAPSRDLLADELAAVANAQGGVLVLGISEKSREIVGISQTNLDPAERTIVEICRDLIDPP